MGTLIWSAGTDRALGVAGCGVGREGLEEMLAAGNGVFEAVTGRGREAASDALRLRLIMVVSSFLNFSRSEYATGWGEVKVKL